MESTINPNQPVAFYLRRGYVYQLVEVLAPAGYALPSVQWRLDVQNDGTITTGLIGTGWPAPDFVYHTYNTVPNVRFLGNFEEFELPLSGGTGSNTHIFTAGGLAIIGLGVATAMLNAKRRPLRKLGKTS